MESRDAMVPVPDDSVSSDAVSMDAVPMDAVPAKVAPTPLSTEAARRSDLPLDELRPDTIVVAAGRPERRAGAPVNSPIELTSTYHSQGVPQPGELLYARYDNAGWHGLEAALGELEGGRCLLFASGLAAVAAVLSCVPDGARLVVPRHAYLGTLGQADELAERHGVAVVRVDIADTEAVCAALEPGAAMLWIESPTNPMLEVADVPALIAAAHRVGALAVVDNTFATPLRQRPLALGADVVVHSVTKYIAGHSDLVMGATVSADPGLSARLDAYRTRHGSIAGSFEAALALRGLRTLALRLDRAEASAAELAARLAAHPAVEGVHHPSLPSDPGHQRALEQLGSYGAVIGMRVRGGASAADHVVAALRLWTPATSLGGVESLVERRQRYPNESPSLPPQYVRLAVGIENVEDLWADLAQALAGVVASGDDTGEN